MWDHFSDLFEGFLFVLVCAFTQRDKKKREEELIDLVERQKNQIASLERIIDQTEQLILVVCETRGTIV